jgi:hypothetical protein
MSSRRALVNCEKTMTNLGKITVATCIDATVSDPDDITNLAGIKTE